MAKKRAKRSKRLSKARGDSPGPRSKKSRILVAVRRKFAVSLCRLIGQPGFPEFMDGVKDIISCLPPEEQNEWAAALKAEMVRLGQRRENGETLHCEGTAANAARARETMKHVCRLYRMVRHSFPAGRKGNGKAIREVALRHQRSTGRDKPLTPQAIRNNLKRGGVQAT